MIRHIAVLTRLLVLFQCPDASAEEKTALLEMNSNVMFTHVESDGRHNRAESPPKNRINKGRM